MSTKLSLSIALTTYNGEQYIREQLDSIVRQTMLPDELVISDDASVDSTFDIIKDFERSAPFPVKLQINQKRLGSTLNFESAIRACSGDIIFLCDQDDVWYPDKIARIEECFVNNPKAGAVFTDADIVDQNLQSYGPKLWKKIRFNLSEQKNMANDAFTVLLKHFVVTGATMAFRSSFKEFVFPIPEEWVHDAWIAFLISASSNLIAIPTPLIAYRQHSSNQIGVSYSGKNLGKSFSSIYSPRVLLHKLAKVHLLEHADSIPNVNSKIVRLNEKITFLSVRAKLPVARWRRIPILIRELFLLRYHRYAKKHVGTFLNDLLRDGRVP